VRNIYKYYIAYTLIEDADAAKKAMIGAAKPAPGADAPSPHTKPQ
jgi:hypothetical protein